MAAESGAAETGTVMSTGTEAKAETVYTEMMYMTEAIDMMEAEPPTL